MCCVVEDDKGKLECVGCAARGGRNCSGMESAGHTMRIDAARTLPHRSLNFGEVLLRTPLSPHWDGTGPNRCLAAPGGEIQLRVSGLAARVPDGLRRRCSNSECDTRCFCEIRTPMVFLRKTVNRSTTGHGEYNTSLPSHCSYSLLAVGFIAHCTGQLLLSLELHSQSNKKF